MEKERVYKLRSRKTDNQLSPEQYRTYLDDFLIYFSVSSMILLLTSGYVLQDIMHYPLLESVKTLLTKPQILKASGEYKSVTTAIGTYISAIASLSWFVADKINKPSNLVEIKKDGSNYYVRNDGLEEYKKYQGDTSKGIVILEKDTDGVDLVLDNKTAELGFFVVGEAGSGKTVFIKRFLEHWVNMLEKCILHDPKLEFIEDLLNANVPVVLIAPWIGQSKVIDYAKLIWTDNDAKRDLLINLFVYSFAGFPNPKKPDFFKDGAVNVLIAITRKVVDKFKDKWSISDWMDTFLENQQVAKLKKLVDEFYPQISYLIDETNPKTTMSILASTVSTVVKLKMLADLWQYNTKYFDIKEWIYAKKPKYQFVALANHQTYGDIASSVIASFVNITSKLVLDPEYKKAYETDKLSGIHYTLDEFNSFGRYIDVVNFKNLPDLGRSAGIRTELFQQRYGQMSESIPGDTELQRDFVGAFQNKPLCRPSDKDFDVIKNNIGPHNEIHSEVSRSDNSQGHNITYKKVPKSVPFEPHVLQNDLGPIPANGKGVYIMLKTVSNPVAARVLIPFKQFCKKRIERLKNEKKYKTWNVKFNEVVVNTKFNDAYKALSKLQLELEDIFKNETMSKEEQAKLAEKKSIELETQYSNMAQLIGMNQQPESQTKEQTTTHETPKEKDEIKEAIVKDLALDAIDSTHTLSTINQGVEVAQAVLKDDNRNVDFHSIEESKSTTESVNTKTEQQLYQDFDDLDL